MTNPFDVQVFVPPTLTLSYVGPKPTVYLYRQGTEIRSAVIDRLKEYGPFGEYNTDKTFVLDNNEIKGMEDVDLTEFDEGPDVDTLKKALEEFSTHPGYVDSRVTEELLINCYEVLKDMGDGTFRTRQLPVAVGKMRDRITGLHPNHRVGNLYNLIVNYCNFNTKPKDWEAQLIRNEMERISDLVNKPANIIWTEEIMPEGLKEKQYILRKSEPFLFSD